MIDSAFGWLNEFILWCAKLIPRWTLVDTRYAAVKWVRGNRVVALGAGVHWYWPAVTTLETYVTARQAANLRAQVVTTADDKTVAVGGLIVYEIKDIVAILANTYDPEETVRDIALTAIHDVCCQKAWPDLKAAQRNGSLDRELKAEVRKALDAYGVKLLKVSLTDLAPCRVLKVIQETSVDGK